MWAAKDDLEDLYGDPLEIWRDWAEDVRGRAIGCGHHIAEEAPDELAAELGTSSASRQRSHRAVTPAGGGRQAGARRQ